MPRTRLGVLLVAMIATFGVLRLSLGLSPNSDFNVGGFNVHHLFTGLLLITAGGIPLALFDGDSRLMTVARAVFGVGLAMALDEWVYLIATDGTNSSYLLPISFRGGVLMIALAILYGVGLTRAARSPNRNLKK